MTSIKELAGRTARRSCLGFVLFACATPALAQREGLVIRQVAFRGNRAIDDLTLANAISTTESSFFATTPLIRGLGLGTRRFLNERELDRDVERLRLLYRISGFLEVRVDTLIRRTEEAAHITFRIVEGRPVILEQLRFHGIDSLLEPEELVEDLPIQVGDPFHRGLVQAAADTIVDRLQERGYPLAEVHLDPENRRVDSAAYRAEIELDVRPGRQMVIGSIRIEGETAEDSEFVRAFISTEPGRLYRKSDILRSQRNLVVSDLYRFVSVEIDSARFDPANQNAGLPLLVRVVPGPRQRISASVGYGTYDCFRGSLGWTGRNALGRGRTIDLSARFSKVGVGRPTDWGLEGRLLCGRLEDDPVGSERMNYGLNAALRRPGLFGPANIGVLGLFAERGSEFAVYLREEFGSSFQFTRETGSRVPVTLGYRLAFGFTTASDANFCAYFNACTQADILVLRERQRRGTVSVGLTSLRVNNPLDPSNGTSVALQTAFSTSWTGSEERQRFVRIIGDAAAYKHLGKEVVLATRIRAGMLFAPTVELPQAGRAPYAPPDQRFYAGGPNDVRGFDGNQLGPLVYVFFDSLPASHFDSIPNRDTLSVPTDGIVISPVGGNRVVVGNLELRLPSPVFRSRARVAVFLDLGSVWQDSETQGVPIRLRATPGAGIRFATPLGPARLDVAYNSYDFPPGDFFRFSSDGELVQTVPGFRLERGPHFTFHFAIGQAF